MKQARSALKITIPFILGILFCSWIELSFVIAFTLWTTILISLIVTIFHLRDQIDTRKLIGFQLVALFFLSGVLGYSAQLKSNILYHFSKHTLAEDQLLIKVIEFQKGLRSYDKVLAEVEKVISIDDKSKNVEGKLLCYIKRIDTLEINLGDKLLINSKLNPIENDNNPGEFNQEKFWKYKGVDQVVFVSPNEIKKVHKGILTDYFWSDFREYLKKQLAHNLKPEASRVAVALSLGDKSLLKKETRDSFANAGAMHVLAVSGLHVGILLGIIQWICFQIKALRNRNLYIFISIFLIWCFAFLTGLSPSVFRASLMFTILALGQVRGENFFSLNGLLISGLFLLIINPFYLFDIGFQLSYLAMLGIILFYGPISRIFVINQKQLKWLWDGTSIGIAAQIGTLPISLYYFHQFPNYFIVTNIGLMLLSGIALGSILLFFVTHAIPYLVDVVSYFVSLIFEIIIEFISFINTLPVAVSKGFSLSVWQVVLAYFLIGLLWFFNEKKSLKKWTFSAIMLFLLAVFVLFERNQALNKSELIVFNNKYQTVVYKNNQNLFCLYDRKAKGKEEEIAFSVEGYHKKMGGRLTYLKMPDEKSEENSLKIISNSDNLVVNSSKAYNKIHHKDDKLILPYKNIDTNKVQGKIIKGKWSRYYNSFYHYDASVGAVKF